MAQYTYRPAIATDWAEEAEKLRREAPLTAARMLKEADQITEMIRGLSCSHCTIRIDAPNDNRYSKAIATHEITCPYA